MNDEELQRFIEEVESNAMLTAPKRMKQEILQKSRNSVEQIVMEQPIEKAKKVANQLQFWLYSLKISAAVVVAVCCVFLINAHEYTPSKIPLPEQIGDERSLDKEDKINVGHYMNSKMNEMGAAMGQFYAGLQNSFQWDEN